MTPKNVLIKRKNVELDKGKIAIKSDPNTSNTAKEFAEYYSLGLWNMQFEYPWIWRKKNR